MTLEIIKEEKRLGRLMGTRGDEAAGQLGEEGSKH